MENAHGGHRAHDRDLSARPRIHASGAQGRGVHRHECAAIGLAGHHGDAGHHAFGEGMQELGPTADDAIPLLAHAREVSGYVDEDDEGHRECVAHAHEARGLLRAGGVQAATEA